RLNASGPAGSVIQRTLQIQNTGTAELTNVTMSETLPSGWKVTYDPAGPIASIPAKGSQTMTANITPANNAIAGDYVATFHANAGASATEQSTDIRVTIETPLNWLVVGGGIIVAGFDPRRESLQVKRRVGYLPDSVGFYGNLTGRENLRYTAQLNGIPTRIARSQIDQVLEQVGLTDRADDRTDAYSRGMRQRLGIADALVKDPEILILDEPTTAIDPIGVAEILDLIRGLARDSGIAILLASHLLDQVQTV